MASVEGQYWPGEPRWVVGGASRWARRRLREVWGDGQRWEQMVEDEQEKKKWRRRDPVSCGGGWSLASLPAYHLLLLLLLSPAASA